MAAEGSTIYYYQNGAKVYTSTGTLTYPLLIDSSLYTTSAQVSNAQLSAANLVVILLMVAVFLIALFAPFPGRRRR